MHVGAVLPAPGGGAFLSLYSPADEWISYLARFDDVGAPLWVHEHEPGTARLYDLAYDPAGTLYGARIDEVCAFAP